MAIAPTWKIQAPVAINIPRANRRDLNRHRAVRTGWRMSTAGAAQAPRCLNRKPTFVARAQASASSMPRVRVKLGLRSPGTARRPDRLLAAARTRLIRLVFRYALVQQTLNSVGGRGTCTGGIPW